ncbi:MAG: hypothetical protein H0U38_07705 [Chloroflexia bacterium]|jgi:hypothetical protein|nr:hypothetical protein [Chloroflexia bacterium]MDQ3525195.1 hypothetical protein [Chloroflexota bacterium]
MADLSSNPDSSGDPGDAAGVRPGTPRWVKVFGIIALVVVLLIAALMLTGGSGGGGHGPGRHAPSGDTPSTSVIEDHTPPSTVTEGHTSSGRDSGYRLPVGSDNPR